MGFAPSPFFSLIWGGKQRLCQVFCGLRISRPMERVGAIAGEGKLSWQSRCKLTRIGTAYLGGNELGLAMGVEGSRFTLFS